MNDQTRVIYIIKRKEKLGRNKCSLKKKLRVYPWCNNALNTVVFFVVLIFCLGADVMVFIIDGHTCPVRWLIKRGNTQTSFRHHNSVVIWSQGTISGSVRGFADSDVGGCGLVIRGKNKSDQVLPMGETCPFLKGFHVLRLWMEGLSFSSPLV